MKNLLFTLFLFLFTLIAIGFSKSYTIDQINIDAIVLPDGNIEINETRTYTFKGKFSWAEYQLPLDKLGEVKLFSLREGSQNYYQSNDELPGSFYIENKNNTFYVRWFYKAKNQTRTFVLKYLVTDAVIVYNDVAELYYKFIGEDNQKEIGFVNINIKLPQYSLQDSVKIWAHGPLHGLINFNNGNVELSVNPMPAEQYLEARIVFPPVWVPNAQNKVQTDILQDIVAEEKLWVEEANRAREKAKEELRIKKENEQEALPVAIGISILILFLVFWLYNKYGKAFQVPYNLKVDSDIPKSIHPTILNCLYYKKQVYASAISTTIFDLARRDILAIEQIQPKDRRWWQPKIQYVFKLNRIGWNEIRAQMKDFENDMLDFFFNDVGNGEDSMNTLVFKKSTSKMRKWFENWKKLLKAHFKHIPLYEQKSVKITTFAAIISAIIIAGGVFTLIFIGSPGIIVLASGLISFALSFAILRFTEDMKLKRKKWEALRNYLKKYHFTNEASLTWQSQIGEYLVYGLALGVGKKAIEKMITTVPTDQHSVLFPWYIYAPGTTHSPADFAHAITSVVTVASTTVSSAAGAGGGATSGGGGGAGGASGGAG
ncbi:MAG: DUF2207 domain-containing protein [Calditrichia bacterium]|nr:DUF2207 domain-containing protein [Calditrichia bacterium]